MNELDKKAYEMFGVSSFAQLSAFGKRDVRMALHTFTGVNMDHVDLVRALAAAQKENEELRKELREAWEENEDLKLQQITEEDDESRTSRSTRRGQSRTSGGADSGVSDTRASEGSSGPTPSD